MEDLSSFSNATILVRARFLSALRYSISRVCGEEEGILGCLLLRVRVGGEVGDSGGGTMFAWRTAGGDAIDKGIGTEYREEGKRQS